MHRRRRNRRRGGSGRRGFVFFFFFQVFAFAFAHALLEAAYPPLKSCGAFRKSNVLVVVGGGAKKEGTATYAAENTR